MAVGPQEELVDSITLYSRKTLLFHGYVWPFIGLYGLWAMVWSTYLPEESAFEAGMIGLAIIITIQTLVYLCCHWSVHICAYLTCTPETQPLEASIAKVVPTPTNGSAEFVKIYKVKDEGSWLVWLVFQETKYEWNFDSNCFEAIDFPVSHRLSTYLNHKGYLDDAEVTRAVRKYGANKTTMRIPSFQEFFTERATAPFFVFQVFCVLLWCLDEYWMYSVFTLFMLVVFECTVVQQQLRNMSEIRNMGNKPYKIQVYRAKKWRPINSDEVLPGDVVSVGRSQTDELIPCDMLLLRGPCIVDESMLTGESVPQMKEPIESEFVDGKSLTEDRKIDLESDGKLRILFGGTKMVQHTPPTKSTTALRSPDNGCICFVLRTGFSTSQGKLLRTIMYGVKRVTANNLETFAFIMFLLIFAIAAAAYVWVKGTEDPDRNRYKLFLECTLILTSVVPPELPIELSLAVNSSVLSLSRLGVFCTEPFRIPFAGKSEVCCFDKTGTLTSDNLVIEGVAMKGGNSKPEPLSNLSVETIQTLATCHSLVTLEDGTVVGDPLEKVTLKWIDWDINKDVVVPKKTSTMKGVKIFHRFHFSSALKRMSVVGGYSDGNETEYFAAVKGAPEIMKSMFAELPKDYDDTYLSFTRRGARVLALGLKKLGRLNTQDIRQLSREDIESELQFQGFIIVSCPLKPDSKAVIHEIMHSSHMVVMITGDSPLTACHVAKQLKMTTKEAILILNAESLNWESIDASIQLPFDSTEDSKLTGKYDLCLTGDSLSRIITYQEKGLVNHLTRLLPHVVVYARMAPKQKEWVINAIKSLGFCTLMCGDGTNDVGALKHAHVGVAILSHCPEWVEKRQKLMQEIAEKRLSAAQSNGSEVANPTPASQSRSPSRVPAAASSRSTGPRRAGAPLPNRPGAGGGTGRSETSFERQLAKMMKELEEEEKGQIVKLGDASIAAPFSSKMSSIECICHVIKQGRCTLVTTLQMFKILALNALVLAYSQSVLYLDGIKLSDSQATFHGLLLAACFFFISHSKPLKSLSKKRPLPNIFNAYTLLTVLLQFAIHFVVIIYLVRRSLEYAPEDRPPKIDLEKKFEPNMLNSTVYVISLALQITTFFVNYRGHPFMESISENRAFFYSILMAGSAVVTLVTRFMPDMCDQFEVVPFPYEFQKTMLIAFIGDLLGAFAIDRLCMWLFGEGKLTVAK